ncbi:MAG: hypothetical protein EOO07_18995 [Chitinophagaceae bacterium]|nr:MAG: hypothetical protein EOO07_18995 [Chitinophagaceae bacterium]
MTADLGLPAKYILMKHLSDSELADALRLMIKDEAELNEKISSIILSAKDPRYLRGLKYYKDQLEKIQITIKMIRFALTRSESKFKEKL